VILQFYTKKPGSVVRGYFGLSYWFRDNSL